MFLSLLQGGYMNAKISKLENQFEKEKVSAKEQNEKLSDIFYGVSIFVNGYTQPSADELRCLMLLHGGTYHHYHRPKKTTHIIASALPNSKFDQMETFHVVKPEWITESIKAGKLLNCNNYLLKNDFPHLFHYNIHNQLLHGGWFCIFIFVDDNNSVLVISSLMNQMQFTWVPMHTFFQNVLSDSLMNESYS